MILKTDEQIVRAYLLGYISAQKVADIKKLPHRNSTQRWVVSFLKTAYKRGKLKI